MSAPPTTCALKRCQGNRGCICPKGKNLPSGTFSGVKPTAAATTISTTRLPQIKGPEQKVKPQGKVKSPKKQPSLLSQPAPRATELAPPVVATPPPTVSEPSAPPVATAATESPPQNGTIVVRYNHYKKEFPITHGSTTSEAVDSQYFLSGVFPNSVLHLSQYGPSDFSYEADGVTDRPMVREAPPGVYQDLVAGGTYWIYVEEDEAERAAYEKRQAEFSAAKAKDRADKEEQEKRGTVVREKIESCSCIEGNPCVDKYCCKDWDNRHAVAKKHGWKGFQ